MKRNGERSAIIKLASKVARVFVCRAEDRRTDARSRNRSSTAKVDCGRRWRTKCATQHSGLSTAHTSRHTVRAPSQAAQNIVILRGRARIDRTCLQTLGVSGDAPRAAARHCHVPQLRDPVQISVAVPNAAVRIADSSRRFLPRAFALTTRRRPQQLRTDRATTQQFAARRSSSMRALRVCCFCLLFSRNNRNDASGRTAAASLCVAQQKPTVIAARRRCCFFGA